MIDTQGRVLLIHERYELNGQPRDHWLTPGGGVEAGEDPRESAVREAYEETGITLHLAPDAPEILTTRRLWSWRELHFDQTDHFFCARVPAGVPVHPRGLTEVEMSTLLGHRWWTVDELRATDATVLPPQLADVLAALLAQPVTG